MRKPRLAEGSRWNRNNTEVASAIGRSDVAVYVDSDSLLRLIHQCNSMAVQFADALAVIRAAGLDPVWSAAVKLRQYVGSPGATRIGIDELTSKLCDAVDVSSERDNSDA